MINYCVQTINNIPLLATATIVPYRTVENITYAAKLAIILDPQRELHIVPVNSKGQLGRALNTPLDYSEPIHDVVRLPNSIGQSLVACGILSEVYAVPNNRFTDYKVSTLLYNAIQNAYFPDGPGD